MTLEELYNDGVNPFEEIVPKDPRYRELSRKISDERDYFESLMSEKDIERHEEYNELLTERAVIDCRESFVYGFRLAAHLMIDALTGGATK